MAQTAKWERSVASMFGARLGLDPRDRFRDCEYVWTGTEYCEVVVFAVVVVGSSGTSGGGPGLGSSPPPKGPYWYFPLAAF